MAYRIRRVDYFYTTIRDEPGQGYRLLSLWANLGINLLAFTAVPFGPMNTQLTIFPEDSGKFSDVARKSKLPLDGPQQALLVQGDDELGALAEVHMKLYEAHVNVFASSGVSDGKGSYGYLIYVRPEDYERAVTALKV